MNKNIFIFQTKAIWGQFQKSLTTFANLLWSFIFTCIYSFWPSNRNASLSLSQNYWAKCSIIGPAIYVWPVNFRVYSKKLYLHAARESRNSPNLLVQKLAWKLHSNCMKSVVNAITNAAPLDKFLEITHVKPNSNTALWTHSCILWCDFHITEQPAVILMSYKSGFISKEWECSKIIDLDEYGGYLLSFWEI